MGRRNESPEKKKRRALIAELLKDTPIKDGEDVNALMRELRFVSYKDLKPLMADLKRVYAAPTEETALFELDTFEEKWSKYPKIAVSWRKNWPTLSTYFKYPQEVRTLIYTTNMIENFNRQLRKVTKSKTIFPTDDSLIR
jgi:putative transposase